MTGNVEEKSSSTSREVEAPSISLPKGGGAIRGVGEKFSANPVNGTGSVSVPIATSPGRSGFGPQLSLSYDSGSGNGPFGFGWSVSLPSITRKTDKGLPRYFDTEDSDVFILSGAEDLVPVYRHDADGSWVAGHPGYRRDPDGTWVRDAAGRLVIHEDERDGYRVRRYRPRVEGLFARIERWTNLATGETHWRSISKDNVTTLYGRDDNSRIADHSADPSGPERVFCWLICQSYDDKGNAIAYEYAEENSAGVDGAQAHEANRRPDGRSANRYLKGIRYGNQPSLLADIDPVPPLGADLSQTTWLFEVVLDYGEGHYEQLPPDAQNQQFVKAQVAAPHDAWPVRADPFSTYRAAFEIRTYRLCQRVLTFHHFPKELGIPDCLVRSTEFEYRQTPTASFLQSITQSGYVQQSDGTYLKKSLPPLEFEYTLSPLQDEPGNPYKDDFQLDQVDSTSLENLPVGPNGSQYQWADLNGEGISGILSEQASAWFYKPNLGGARFGPLQTVIKKPSLAALGSGRQQLLDFAGDGQLALVDLGGGAPGFFERTEDEDWSPFRAFRSLPNIAWHDPNLRLVDLTGDGLADVLITEGAILAWHPSLAKEGFGTGTRISLPSDQEEGPRLIFADGTQSIYLAQMSGGGLSDLVRIRNGEICYWPNLGYGRFGAMVTMDNSPWFDRPELFDQRRMRLADTDGSGTTDLIYLGHDGIRIFLNQSGNSWSDARTLKTFPRTDNLASVAAVDLLGTGTACLVWSSPLRADARGPMRYIDLMKGQKPHLLVNVTNNLGAETRITYASSTEFYLADKAAGTPWVTRLAFPVHVVGRVETVDRISHNRFVTRYAYHHGYFDGIEREFRGFGMVEQWDTEEFAVLSTGDVLPDATNIDAASHVPPVLTRTWFHTGAWLEEDSISQHMAHEYFGAPSEADSDFMAKWNDFEATLLPDTVLPNDIRRPDGTRDPHSFAADEYREAVRSLKGSILRQEIYAEDGSDRERIPYSVSERNYTIECLQPQGGNRHGVFFTHARETIDYHYERNPQDPRISHSLVLGIL